MRVLIGAILIDSITAVALIAQSRTPDARALLIRSGGDAVKAYTVRMAGTESRVFVLPARRETETDSFVLERSGNRARFEAKSGDHTELQVADGSNLWRYTSNPSEYSRRPVDGRAMNDPLGRIESSRDPDRFHNARSEREDTLEFGGRQVSCYVIRAAYDSLPGIRDALDVVRTVWIAKDSDLVLRDTWEYSTDALASLAMGKSSITTDYTAIEAGIALAGSLFVFHPPAGSRQAPVLVSDERPPLPEGVYRVGGGVSAPVLLSQVQPEYAGVPGTVMLYIQIDPTGTATHIRVIKSLGDGSDAKAIEGVKRWRFQPGLKDGKPVTVEATIEVNFRQP